MLNFYLNILLKEEMDILVFKIHINKSQIRDRAVLTKGPTLYSCLCPSFGYLINLWHAEELMRSTPTLPKFAQLIPCPRQWLQCDELVT